MGACYDKACDVEALASHLIDGSPQGYTNTSGQWANFAPGFHKFDELLDKDFSTAEDDLGTALGLVATTGQGSAQHSTGTKIEPNGLFDNVDLVGNDLEDHWSGRAANNFRNNYQVKLDTVADKQFSIIDVLAAGIEAQEELYKYTHANVLDLLERTHSALEAIDSRDTAVATLALSVLAAAATVAVTVYTGGTGTVVAAQIFIAIAGAASTGSDTSSDLKVDTDDPQEVMNKFAEALGKVTSHFRTRESAISSGFSSVARHVNADYYRVVFADDEFPAYRFKPTGFAKAPGGLGPWHPQ